MPLRFPTKKFVINWCKALILSPGMLFPLTYCLLYSLTSIYLDTSFKAAVVSSATAGNSKVTLLGIGTIHPSWTMDRIRFRRIILKKSSETLQIPGRELPLPALHTLLLHREKREAFIMQSARQLTGGEQPVSFQ